MASVLSGGSAWVRIARENLRFVRRYSGNQIFLYIGLVLLSGYAEGFGIAMFLPIFSADLAHASDPASRAVVSILDTVGAPPTLAGALPVVAVFFVLKGLLLYAAGVVQHRLSAQITRGVRRDLSAALSTADYSYIARQSTASLQNLIVGEVSRATAAYLSFSRLVPNVVNVLVFFGILVLLDWKLTVAVTLAGGLVLLMLRVPARITRTMSKKTSAANVRLASLLIQTIQSFKYLVSTGRFTRFRDHTNEAIDDLAAANYRIGVLYAFTAAIAQPVMVVFLLSIIYWQVTLAGKSLAAMLLAIMYMYRVMLELFSFQQQWQDVAAVSAGVDATLGGIRDLEAHHEKTGTTKVDGLAKQIELRDVTFAYDNAPVLKAINLTIPRRNMVAFVGESGAGKSTLVDLISGALRPQSGEVFVDDKPLSELDLASWRRLIGFVPQECVIFDDSIAANISLWGDGDQAKVEQAARRAYCDQFIKEMPAGYATTLGERGVRLSGGQRQRLAIARELFKEPELLILDEATSALDTESERFVQKSIDELKGNATIVVIAHRLSTVRNCDRIYVLSAGEVVESGTFDELYAKADSRFRKMCDLQALL
jgi:ABC-type multidrug transport system fused ATPase/permease subunit